MPVMSGMSWPVDRMSYTSVNPFQRSESSTAMTAQIKHNAFAKDVAVSNCLALDIS